MPLVLDVHLLMETPERDNDHIVIGYDDNQIKLVNRKRQLVNRIWVNQYSINDTSNRLIIQRTKRSLKNAMTHET